GAPPRSAAEPSPTSSHRTPDRTRRPIEPDRPWASRGLETSPLALALRYRLHGNGEGPDGPIIVETIDAVTGAIAFVIAPELRRRGLGRALIAAMIAQSELRD